MTVRGRIERVSLCASVLLKTIFFLLTCAFTFFLILFFVSGGGKVCFDGQKRCMGVREDSCFFSLVRGTN